jgi:mRNA interferase MazF
MAIQRGDIYFVNLNPVQGREQAGQRPVLVLSINAINQLPLVVTGVVGTKGENVRRDYPTNVRLSPEVTGLAFRAIIRTTGVPIRGISTRRSISRANATRRRSSANT